MYKGYLVQKKAFLYLKKIKIAPAIKIPVPVALFLNFFGWTVFCQPARQPAGTPPRLACPQLGFCQYFNPDPAYTV